VLSDHEWRTLREVERRFLTEDPEFARSFATRAQRLERRHLDGGLAKIAILAAVLLGALMLVAGSPSGALAFAAGAALIWLARRHSNDPPGRSIRPPTRPENDH
jgi:hypothetical protein